MAEITKFKKDELIQLAHAKIKKMKVSELKTFVGVDKPLVVIPEIFKIDISFNVNSYNNSNGGRNSSGGDLYKRAAVRIKNQEINVKNLRYLLDGSYQVGMVMVA